MVIVASLFHDLGVGYGPDRLTSSANYNAERRLTGFQQLAECPCVLGRQGCLTLLINDG